MKIDSGSSALRDSPSMAAQNRRGQMSAPYTSATVVAGFYSLISTSPTVPSNLFYTRVEHCLAGQSYGGSQRLSKPSYIGFSNVSSHEFL